MKKRFIPLLLLAALFLCGCGQTEKKSDRVQVVATLFPQYDFARAVAGEYADVTLLLDYGTDAHSYDPTPADLLKIKSADLFLYTGGEMELWAATLLASAEVSGKIQSGDLTVVDLSASVQLLPSGDGDADEYDPHIWTSPIAAMSMCSAITDALCGADAAHADLYRANAERCKAELAALDETFRNVTENARLDTCYFGGSFAFAYLFDEYGLAHRSVYAGCAAHAEAAAADVAGLCAEVREIGAKVVLYDSPSEQKLAETVAAETGAKLLRLHAIHNISRDEALSGENYLTLMQKNAEILREALQ